MLTPRGWGLVAAAVACLVAGRVLAIPHLDIVAVAAVLVIVVGLAMGAGRRGLDVTRPALLPITTHGESIDVRLRLANRGRLPLGPTLLEDQTPEALHSGASAPLHGLSPGQSVPLAYRAVGRERGIHRFGPLTVRLTDPLSITSRRVELAGTSDVLVLPRMVALPSGVRAAAGRVPGDSGGGVPQPIGDDVGVIREYAVGDDLRRIHWPATAHRGELMVRQSESRHHDRAVILLDRSPGPDLELRIEVAASIGEAFDGQGAEVQLVDDPHDLQVSTFPWEVQIERLARLTAERIDLTALTATLAGGAVGGGTLVVVGTATERLPVMLQRLGRSFDRRIAVLTPGRGATAATEQAVLTARSMGWQVIAPTRLEDLPDAWGHLATSRRGA